jgi:hypothetical protein
MTDPLRSYDASADRLREITGLIPIQILSPHLHHSAPPTVIMLWPPDGPDGNPRHARVVGIRLFHQPREIVIDDICLSGFPVLGGPFDAAAYAIETPMLPLETPVNEGYRGEALRFVAVNWGVFSRHTPVCIYARPWGTPSALPQLFGYLVAEVERATRATRSRNPPNSTPEENDA